MDTLTPTIAHAVRHPIHRDHELSLYIERAKAEKVVSFFGGVLIDLVDRQDYERERQARIAAEAQLQTMVQQQGKPGCGYGGAAGCDGACKSWCGGAA